MAYILMPNGDQIYTTALTLDLDLTGFLTVSNYLSEFGQDAEYARLNLDVMDTEEVNDTIDTKADTISGLKANAKMTEHLGESDPHGILPQVDETLTDYVKKDGSTPFTAAQTGVNPVTDFHLTTKKFVENLLKTHTDATDAHGIVLTLATVLASYARIVDVYNKTDTYSKTQTNALLNSYVKRDGTTPFLTLQKGVRPISDYDLTTKNYVDELIYGYIEESDLVNFKLQVNNALTQKARSSEVYKKNETYSKNQLDLIINDIIANAVEQAVSEHTNNTVHLTLDEIKTFLETEGYEPASNVVSAASAAIAPMAMSISPMSAPINTGDYYTSHGPILSASVGFLTKNRVLPTELSYQDLFDIMLYDSKVMVETNVKLVEKGVSSPISVTMTVTGITQVDTVDLYFNGVKVATYDYNLEFVNGVLTVTGTTPENTSVIPWIDNDTEVKIVVNYTSGDTKEESTHVYAIAPIYVGLIPKWLFGTTLTYDIIQGLVDDTLINVENFDIPIYGTNTCKIIMTTSIGLDIPIHYEFTYDGVERRPFIMYPTTPHPDAGGAGILFAVDCISQTFSIYYYTQSINILLPDGLIESYRLYIYDPAITSLDTTVTYKFN